MPHTAYTGLQLLLQSLSTTEKEFLAKRFTARSNHKTESRMHTLYICMQEDARADDERMYNTWRRKLKAALTQHAYEKTKSELKIFVLETLRLLHAPGHDVYLQQRIDYANILSARGMYADAYKILQLAEKDVYEFTDPLYACIINYKMIHILPYIHEKDKPAQVHALMQETGLMIKNLQVYHTVFAFNLEVALLARQTSVMQTAQHAAQLKKLLQNPLVKTDAETLPYLAQCTLLKSLSWLYRLQGDFLKTFSYQKKLVDALAQKQTYQLQYRPALFLAEWADLVNISLKAEKFTDAEQALEKYKSLCAEHALADVHTQLMITNYTLALQQADDKKIPDKTLAKKQWKQLQTSIHQLQAGHVFSFLCTVMKSFLALKEHSLLHDVYVRILQSAPAERFDVVYAAELIYTLSLYEQAKVSTTLQTISLPEHFISQAESFYRRVHHAELKDADTQRVVNGLKLLAKRTTIEEHCKILSNMFARRLVGQRPTRAKTKQQKNFTGNNLFDFSGWAERKIAEMEKMLLREEK